MTQLMAQVSFGLQFSDVIKYICDHQCDPLLVPWGVPQGPYNIYTEGSGFLLHHKPEFAAIVGVFGSRKKDVWSQA